MEEITDVDYMDRKRVCKDFKIKKLGEYHDLHLTSDTLLLQMFLKILEMCIEIYELDPAKFLSPPGLAWHASLKKIKVKLDLLTDIDMLLMVEKAIRGICNAINRNAKTIMKKVMRDIFLKLILNNHKKCMNFIVTYHFYLKERNLKVEKLATNLHDKNECYTHKQFKTGSKSWLSFEKSS